jgi:phospho-N-acetylmuramoyl-pentapeptide-transferase
MAPLHHHLEKCGWSEGKIVFAFSLLTLLGATLAFISLS